MQQRTLEQSALEQSDLEKRALEQSDCGNRDTAGGYGGGTRRPEGSSEAFGRGLAWPGAVSTGMAMDSRGLQWLNAA